MSPTVLSEITLQSTVELQFTVVAKANPYVTDENKAVRTWDSSNSTLLIYTLH